MYTLMIQKFLLSLSFFTRIPIGKRDFGNANLAESAWAFPVVGALIGALDGLVYLLIIQLGLTNNIAAWLTVIFHLTLTGCLHEDGLADSADGLASGRNREQKLAIMRDSHIGSYGVLALIAIISLRANAIASFNNNSQTLLIFIAAAATSRSLLVLLMRSTPTARSDGLAVAAARPSHLQTIIAISLASLSLSSTGNISAALAAIFTLAVIYVAIKHIATKNFGGISGDTLGAAQQISEVSILLIFLSV
jgi:adenosylcobinamide-GDP ribazoletransferase